MTNRGDVEEEDQEQIIQAKIIKYAKVDLCTNHA